MSQISCVIYRPNSYNLFVSQKNEINLFKYANIKFHLIKAMFVYLALSEKQCIIYRPDLHNSQTSRKKFKKQLMVKNYLSINVKTKNIS